MAGKLFLVGFVAFVLLINATNGVMSQDFSQVEIESIKLTDQIYMLIGSGGNIAVSAGENATYLIDDQYAPLTEKIKKALAKISDKPIRYVINTHWHGDHTGGNENLGKAGAVIIAHDNVRRRMEKGQEMPVFNRTVPPAPKDALPIITFTDELTLHLNDESAAVIHFHHAHTDGDSIIHWPDSNVIHTGDLFFNGIYPFIDVSSGGSINGMIESAETILEMADDKTRIIPGHGPLSNKSEFQKFHDMLVSVRDRAKNAKEKGKTADTWTNDKPLADIEKEWGDGFLSTEQFIQIIWQSL